MVPKDGKKTATCPKNKKNDDLQKKIDNATTEAWRAKVRTRDGGSSDDKRMPVTIVTGFLGAGKTTLIKNILQNTQGMRVLVIENEIGNESIDHELLLSQAGACPPTAGDPLSPRDSPPPCG